ncbi:MAG: Asp-tRNA(Asn)/Glu-tRNA(Gln) amidotransferase subunit GatB [Minisyncoccia bacterium]
MSESSEYLPTIGLEVHVELHTATKMFCGSINDADEKRPNHNICPVCMAHPGTLPVINKKAVQYVLQVGAAIGAKLADYTEFDRKSYFYPDLPKGYQLSQYAYPLVSGGSLHGVSITRIHLEEDTARSQHDTKSNKTLIDYNRAGVPLMELVTEPVLHTAEDAGAFARELQILLRTLGVSHANMEKGEMRVEANISVSNKPGVLGTKVEVKNLNSFNSVEKAIAFEVKRHIEVLKSGGEILQETRGWDENKQVAFAQRIKEGSADYRYFPDPDLPKLKLSEHPEFNKEAIIASLPELPVQIRARYSSYGIAAHDIETYLSDTTLRQFFETVASSLEGEAKKIASNYITSDLMSLRSSQDIPVSPENFKALMLLVVEDKISSRGAKDVLKMLVEDRRDPLTIAQEKGLLQVSDESALRAVVADIVAQNPSVVLEYKSGKVQLLQFFVGQAMKALKGAGNPKILQQIVKEEVEKA